MDAIGKLLLFGGLVIALAGALLLLSSHLPFLGRLPGDLSFRRGGAVVYLPLATSIVLSILLTVLVNVALRLLNR